MSAAAIPIEDTSFTTQEKKSRIKESFNEIKGYIKDKNIGKKLNELMNYDLKNLSQTKAAQMTSKVVVAGAAGTVKTIGAGTKFLLKLIILSPFIFLFLTGVLTLNTIFKFIYQPVTDLTVGFLGITGSVWITWILTTFIFIVILTIFFAKEIDKAIKTELFWLLWVLVIFALIGWYTNFSNYYTPEEQQQYVNNVIDKQTSRFKEATKCLFTVDPNCWREKNEPEEQVQETDRTNYEILFKKPYEYTKKYNNCPIF